MALLMRYVNTLPKRPAGKRAFVACRYLPTTPASLEMESYHVPPPPLQRTGRGVERGKINATSNRALSDTAISRLARGKRESPMREVWKFKRRGRCGNVAALPPRISGSTRHTGSPYPSVVFKVWWLGNVHRVHELWCGVGGKQAKRYELINGLDG